MSVIPNTKQVALLSLSYLRASAMLLL